MLSTWTELQTGSSSKIWSKIWSAEEYQYWKSGFVWQPIFGRPQIVLSTII